jgi:hypothetical protein
MPLFVAYHGKAFQSPRMRSGKEYLLPADLMKLSSKILHLKIPGGRKEAVLVAICSL